MVDLHPFALLHMTDRPGSLSERVSPLVLSATVGAMIVVSAVGVAAFEGTLGGASDLRIAGDVERIVGSSSPGGHDFPLARDAVSWALASIVTATLGLVWWQWQIFGRVLGVLAENGVLAEKAKPELKWWHRVAGYPWVAHGGGLSQLVTRVNGLLSILSNWLLVVLVAAVVLALLLTRSFGSLGVFRLWNPDGSGVSDATFAADAYDNWWASSENFGGSVVYFLIAAIGIFTVLLQNLIGFTAVYVVAALPAYCNFSADWYDVDGGFGWLELGRAFRTVRWSLAMHGIALTLIFAITGAAVWAYTVPLLCLWVVAIPIYLGIPSIVFRNVGRQVKADVLTRESESRYDIGRASFLVPYVRGAAVTPLRVSRFGGYAFLGSVALPIGLTVAQIMGS
jgi:hypothetical protein